MKRNARPNPEDVPLVLEDDDRFHQIIASDTIRYEAETDCESVIVFFVVARGDGTFEIVQVMRTFKGTECVSRQVQKKHGIAADRIDVELADIERVFAAGIEKATGYRIKFHHLDLSEVEGTQAQVAAISVWGRGGLTIDIGGGISLN